MPPLLGAKSEKEKLIPHPKKLNEGFPPKSPVKLRDEGKVALSTWLILKGCRSTKK